MKMEELEAKYPMPEAEAEQVKTIEEEVADKPDTPPEGSDGEGALGEEEPGSEDDGGVDEVTLTDKGKMVPLSVLNKKDEALKQAQEEARLAREQALQYQAYMQGFQQQQQYQQQPETNPFDKEYERENYLEWELAKTNKEIESLKQGYNETQQTQQQQQAVQGAFNQAASILRNSTATHPDMADMYNHVVAKERERALMNNGDPMQAEQAAEMQMLSYFIPGLQGKANLPETIKSLAMMYGYQPKREPTAPDLEAIAKNKQKTSKVGGTTSAPITVGSTDIKKAKRKNGRGVDPQEFRKLLENIE